MMFYEKGAVARGDARISLTYYGVTRNINMYCAY